MVLNTFSKVEADKKGGLLGLKAFSSVLAISTNKNVKRALKSSPSASTNCAN